jgi:hypothetical protein
MHLSYVKNRTISKRTKTSFQLSLITKEYHRVRSKQFLTLWYIQHKTVHLSCVKNSTISIQMETSFQLGLVT